MRSEISFSVHYSSPYFYLVRKLIRGSRKNTCRINIYTALFDYSDGNNIASAVEDDRYVGEINDGDGVLEGGDV